MVWSSFLFCMSLFQAVTMYTEEPGEELFVKILHFLKFYLKLGHNFILESTKTPLHNKNSLNIVKRMPNLYSKAYVTYLTPSTVSFSNQRACSDMILHQSELTVEKLRANLLIVPKVICPILCSQVLWHLPKLLILFTTIFNLPTVEDFTSQFLLCFNENHNHTYLHTYFPVDNRHGIA